MMIREPGTSVPNTGGKEPKAPILPSLLMQLAVILLLIVAIGIIITLILYGV
jgi:hypothetical protein